LLLTNYSYSYYNLVVIIPLVIPYRKLVSKRFNNKPKAKPKAILKKTIEKEISSNKATISYSSVIYT